MCQKKNIKRYIVTAAFPYANGPIHIGHLAGVYIPADIFVRYLRRKKKEVLFVCGSDEHGVPITVHAREKGITPQEVVNKYHSMIKKNFKKFGITFDNYSRTSSKIHRKTASDFFRSLYKRGILMEKEIEQYYDEEAKQFLADRYILGTCPFCMYQKAYGDQCEKCGSSLSNEELIQPKSTLSGRSPVMKKTKHWYFPLEKYEKFLKKWIAKYCKNYWKSNVYGQVKSWLDDGLKPRAVTRDLEWGITVPIEGVEGKVIYVWFEAPIGYLSSTMEWAKRENKNWKFYWKNKESSLINFIGKDNIVFHCIIFPAMLKAHGGYIFTENVQANEFLNLENKKISTSKNWAVWLHEFLEDFPKQQDALRYILTVNMPETKDNNFSWKEFQTRFNSELVSIVGNFVHRNMMLVHKHFQGKIPTKKKLLEKDKKILEKIKKTPKKIGFLIENYRFREALTFFVNLARIGNKYLTEESPWKKGDRIESILYISMQITGMIAQLAEPFLPFSAKKLYKLLNIKPFPWDDIENREILSYGHVLSNPEFLFKKIEDSDITKQLEKLQYKVRPGRI